MGGLRGVVELHKPRSGKSPNVVEYLQSRKLDLVINDPETERSVDAEASSPANPSSPTNGVGHGRSSAAGGDSSITDGYLIRRTAIDFGVSLITNTKVAVLLALALERVKSFHIKAMEEYYATTSPLDTA
jgi:hypothetical protein